jgi:hypothetical protein
MHLLFVIYSKVHLRALGPFLEAAARDTSNQVSILVGLSELKEHKEELEKFGKVYFSPLSERPSPKPGESHRGKIGKSDKKIRIFSLLKKYLIEFARVTKELIYLRTWSDDFLKKVRPDAIFLSAERYIDLDLPLAKQAEKQKLPCFIAGIDYFYVENFQGFAISRKPLDFKRDPIEFFISKIFPSLTFMASEKKYLFYGAGGSLALFFTNLMLKNPQLSGCHSSVKKIFVDSEETKIKYLEWGFPERKLVVSGLGESKDLLNSKTHKNSNKYFEKRKINIVFSIPQLYEHFILTKDAQFEFLRKMFKVICDKDTNILLSLHPKQNREEYIVLEKEFPVQILDTPLKYHLGIADLYLCTYSSTVLWSIFLKTRTMIVDFFGLKYTYFRNSPAVEIFEDPKLFEEHFSLWKASYLDSLETHRKGSYHGENFGNIDSCQIALSTVKEYVNS